MKLRNVSGHPEDLESGRVIGAGETFTLSAEEAESDYNKAKIEDGNFLEIVEPQKTNRRQKELAKHGGGDDGNQNTDPPGGTGTGDDNGGNA